MKDNIILGILIGIVSLIVALVVGSGMISKTLTVPGIPEFVIFIAGWVVIIVAIIGTILTVFTK
ncbi:hypothetical protein KAI32_04240 [Candidatus Pacearchaeota archaeon]|nr:hypothetical protein [Candidatus Pacearchaeota archaeon]